MNLRLVLGRAALALVPFAALGLAECVLRLVDPPPEDPRWKDPYVRPLVDEDGAAVLDAEGRPLRSNEPTMAGFAGRANVERRFFTAYKEEGSLRVFSLGASTTFGLKYAPYASYSRFLDARLAAQLGPGRVEVINVGISGYDSDDLPRITRELLEYEPDLLLLYAGHNELKYPNLARVKAPLGSWVADRLSKTALLWRWFAEPEKPPVPARLSTEPFLDEEEFERALARYVEAVRSIVGVCERRGVAVALCTPASNVRDKLPRQSLLKDGGERVREALRELELRWSPAPGATPVTEVDPAQVDELRDPFDDSGRDAAAMSPDAARAADDLGRVDELLAAEPEAALAHYLRARILLRLEREEEARAAFRRSRELDRLPERAWPALVDAVRDIAADSEAVLVDVEQRLADEAEAGVPGFDLFFDYCHPNLRGHYLIADEILETLRREEILAPARDHAAFDAAAEGFAELCASFEVEKWTLDGTIQRCKELIGDASIQEGDAQRRILAAVDEFLLAVLRDSSEADTRAEAHTLAAIVAAIRGDAGTVRSSLRLGAEASAELQRQLLFRMSRNSYFRERFEAVGVEVGLDGSYEVGEDQG